MPKATNTKAAEAAISLENTYLCAMRRFHQLHRDGILMIAPDASDLDEAEALSLFDEARRVVCGGAQ